MDVWRQFTGPRYHVIGNHDTDGDGRIRPDRAYAFTREQTMAYWEMERRFYSFDLGGIHFVVLDGNDEADNPAPGYRRFVAADQAEWFKSDLVATRLTTLVFIHQSLERADGGVENQEEIRAIMERANREAAVGKVVACFSGHHHRDYVRRIGAILYPQINSASYHWLGGDFLRVRYGKEIDEKFPYIKYTVPYKDSLYALVTVDPERSFMKIEGVRSEFVGPAPWKLGKTRDECEAGSLAPAISDWRIPL